jgi:hypothetical protein
LQIKLWNGSPENSNFRNVQAKEKQSFFSFGCCPKDVSGGLGAISGGNQISCGGNE